MRRGGVPSGAAAFILFSYGAHCERKWRPPPYLIVLLLRCGFFYNMTGGNTFGWNEQSEKKSGCQNIFFFHINSPIATEIITEKPKMVSKASGLSDKGRSRTFMP